LQSNGSSTKTTRKVTPLKTCLLAIQNINICTLRSS